MALELTDFVLRILLAFLVGVIIGLERQWRQRNAGLRTNTLVAVGSAIFVMISQLITDDASPSRIAAQIVSGIGFLGAGVIMKEGLNVKGLNTAATLWCAAAVGSLAGMGKWQESLLAAVAIFAIHASLRPLGTRINRRPIPNNRLGEYDYQISIRCTEETENHLRNLLIHTLSDHDGLQLRSLESKDESDQKVSIHAILYSNGLKDELIERILAMASMEPGVSGVSWKKEELQEEI
ncbi:MAG: MgtC/SapB family protein [Cyclobacteriaceae bacterium]|nr:MgtC/SapB family protein [Cyclobacteriaceae bacterium]MCH8517318.1 MgtC/SapB family protein [Cyclobacteriaceae bacterium]